MRKTLIILLCAFLLVIPLVLGACASTATDTPSGSEEVSYNIVEQKDLSFSTAVRISVRLTMNADVTQQEIEWIAQDVVSNITNQQGVNAICIFMYYSGDDCFGVARVAVDWAPYGDWSRAIDVTTGNYQHHQYSYNYY
jgi:hypothetical protein